eukprot:CAMPEP_0206537768 /NCGR_PEP_ID=MMETSP0325_2-20121206/7494_1 /ASSEMBLY_ACC=CAM_ASM_000347 /TAXON_ID=2866 /ORGANISM="Crypthecodinium cohnii, Strain Seligo" /LENGTH=321 /DNA_ID=CAMNT_0054035139 /DNA_START=56 /DNA_END=1018 /DNA_ORIENTATION=-
MAAAAAAGEEPPLPPLRELRALHHNPVMDVPLSRQYEVFRTKFGRSAELDLNRSGAVFQGISVTCDDEVHAFLAHISQQNDEPDELMKFAWPRTYVRLGTDEAMDVAIAAPTIDDKYAGNLHRFGERRVSGGACPSMGFLHCPLGVPVAMTGLARSGSRSMRHWALLLEQGLLEGIEELRQRIMKMLPSIETPRGALAIIPHPGAGENSVAVWRDYMTTLRNEEVFWLGCTAERAELSVQLAGRHLHKGVVAAHLEHSPTCCRTAAGRLQILVVRHPFARFWSTFEQTYRRHEGEPTLELFERWSFELFRRWPEDHSCRTR